MSGPAVLERDASPRPAPARAALRSRPPWHVRAGRWLARRAVPVYAVLVLLYLFAPVAVIAVFSFNRTVGRFNFTWEGFTLEHWLDPCGVAGLCDAMISSLQVATLATVGATVLGTMIAYTLVRRRFRGRTTTNLLVFLPMSTPEVVMGSSLLALFLNVGASRGFWTIVVAHVMFDIGFVVVTVKARLQGEEANLEEAAMDLYADEWTAFRKVTFPLMLPGIIAAAMLAFALSFDDFIITNFVSGGEVTFPMFVWGAAQRGIPPQVNVMATAMFVVAVGAVVAGRLIREARS